MKTSTDTAAAQRRLLEALGALNHTAGGIVGMQYGIPLATRIAYDNNMPALAHVWEALSDLAEAVKLDQRKERTRG